MTKEKDDDIKVNDRRLFSSDGTLRGELPEEEAAPEVEAVTQTPEEKTESKETGE